MLTSNDIDLLREMAPDPRAERLAGRVTELWEKADDLLHQLGGQVFGRHGYATSLWPDGDDDDLLPFLWARLKREDCQGFATHIGLFVSPDFCNMSLDLEKDLIDAGESEETLDHVLAFYRDVDPSLLADAGQAKVKVWMDSKNVVDAGGFSAIDFDAFCDNNRDHGHPWPKAGYLLDISEVVGFADGWVDAYTARANALVPLYDAAIRSFRRAS